MPAWERGRIMKLDLNCKALRDDRVNISFNVGLEMALFILEMAEGCLPKSEDVL